MNEMSIYDNETITRGYHLGRSILIIGKVPHSKFDAISQEIHSLGFYFQLKNTFGFNSKKPSSKSVVRKFYLCS